MRKESEKAGGKLKEGDMAAILNESTGGTVVKISLDEEMSERMAAYGKFSEENRAGDHLHLFSLTYPCKVRSPKF